jgi:hypothetical protein
VVLNEVITLYAQYHKCSRPKEKVYGFRELVPQWKENFVVVYERSYLAKTVFGRCEAWFIRSEILWKVAGSISLVIRNGIERSQAVQRLCAAILSEVEVDCGDEPGQEYNWLSAYLVAEAPVVLM